MLPIPFFTPSYNQYVPSGIVKKIYRALSFAAPLTKTGGGELDLFGESTTTGGCNVNAGTVSAQHALALGVGGNVTVAALSQLQLAGGFTWSGMALSITGAGPNTDGALRSLSGNNTWAGNITVVAGGTTRIQCDANNFTISGNIVLSPTTTDLLSLQGSGTSTISGIISGVGKIGKSGIGGGTWTLSGANTFTGVVSTSGASFSIATFNSVTGGSASSSLGAPTTVANGTIAMGGTLICTGTGETTDRVIDLTGSCTLTQSGTGNMKFTSAATASGGGNKTLTLNGSTAGTGEFSAAIVDNSGANKTSLTKSGTGLWKLSGTCTFTGATTVSAGELQVTGATNSGSAVSVSGGTLGGTGTVAGAVTVANVASSKIRGGTGAGSAGTLTTGALVFSGSTAALDVTSDGTNPSIVAPVGTTTLGGATVNLLGAMAAGTYNIIAGSAAVSGTVVIGTNSSGRTVVSCLAVGNNLVLVLS